VFKYLRLRLPEKKVSLENRLLYLAKFTIPGGQVLYKFGCVGGDSTDLDEWLKDVCRATGYIGYENILDLQSLLNVKNLSNKNCWFLEQCVKHHFGCFTFVPRRENPSPTEWYTAELPNSVSESQH
jgi:hypothetical protein